jgi:hypothetical protein
MSRFAMWDDIGRAMGESVAIGTHLLAVGAEYDGTSGAVYALCGHELSRPPRTLARLSVRRRAQVQRYAPSEERNTTMERTSTTTPTLAGATALVLGLCAAVLGSGCRTAGLIAYDGPERPPEETARLEKPDGFGLTIRALDKAVTTAELGNAVLILAPGKHTVEWEPNENLNFRPKASGRHACVFEASAGHRYTVQVRLITINSIRTDAAGNATAGGGTGVFFISDADSQASVCTFEPSESSEAPQTVAATTASQTSTDPGTSGTESGAESDELQDFRRGVTGSWVVTRNPDGKLFVHTGQSGGTLVGLRYLVREEGDSWTVYQAVPGFSGTDYGRSVGALKRPRGVNVGACSCR